MVSTESGVGGAVFVAGGEGGGKRVHRFRHVAAPVGPGQVVVFVGLGGGDVCVVGDTAAGETDVEVLAVQACAGKQEAVIDGGALGGVDGGGPSVGRVLAHVGGR